MSALISSSQPNSGEEHHDENDRLHGQQPPLSQPPTKPPLSSSFSSAALVANALRPLSSDRPSNQSHSPVGRRSSSVLANRTARSSQLIRTPIETYLPSLQIVYGAQSVSGEL